MPEGSQRAGQPESWRKKQLGRKNSKHKSPDAEMWAVLWTNIEEAGVAQACSRERGQ